MARTKCSKKCDHAMNTSSHLRLYRTIVRAAKKAKMSRIDLIGTMAATILTMTEDCKPARVSIGLKIAGEGLGASGQAIVSSAK